MPSSSSSFAKHAGSFLGVLAAICIVGALTFALHARVALSEAQPARGPLPVETTTFVLQDTYSRPGSYLGTVVASRKSTLGFEIGGTLATAPPREGTPVATGEVIAQLDQSSLLARIAAAEANLSQARSELKLANIKAKRQRNLSETGSVSREAYDETRLQAEALSARVESSRAQLQSLQVDFAKTVLKAPYSGVIADRFVYDATVLNPGAPVVRLVETGAREAHIGLPVERSSELEMGTTHSLRFRDATVPVELLALRPDINPATRSTTAIFSLPDTAGALDGEPAVLELETEVSARGGWLPLGALLEGYRGTWTVLTTTPEGEHLRTQREIVEVLDIQGDRVFVRGSIPDGAVVVASGLHRISPGSLVTIAER